MVMFTDLNKLLQLKLQIKNNTLPEQNKKGTKVGNNVNVLKLWIYEYTLYKFIINIYM